ncbi:MAG: hypothetical protein A2Y25_10080 [Candidatus Melainabacteria bacterium GWF2_37_15]|nr:MAG: hypothetical protein A2Y25_10080 [Candidatus Melainabacteria bacterium GWF2_37_15]
MVLRVTEFNSIFNTPGSFYKAAPVHNEQNSIFNRLKEDIDRLETRANETNKHSHTDQALLYALSPLPPARRIQSLPDTFKEDNWPRAGLLLGMAVANFPRDLGEMRRAWDEGANIIKNGIANTPFSDAQRPFHLLRGTVAEKSAKKYPKFKRVYDSLNKFDETLYNTKFGKFFRKLFNIEECGIKKFNSTGMGTSKELGKLFNGNYGQKVIAKSLLRVSRLSLATSVLLEIPALIKSATAGETVHEKAKSFTKQLCKSAGYVALVTGGIAVAGAMVAPSLIASLVGMGIGASLGLMASKALNKQIDKVFV